MQLITISDYCQQRQVKSQFVYEYIRKGKFEVVEMPVFAEWQGKKFSAGVQKFLKISDAYLIPSDRATDSEYTNSVATQITNRLGLSHLKTEFEALIAAEAPQKELNIKAFEGQYPEESKALFSEFRKLMIQEAKEIHSSIVTLRNEVADLKKA